MKHTILALFIFLVGCCSLESEISHCGEKCCTQHCYGIRQCYPMRDCAPQVVSQPKFCNNGSSDYDNYRIVPRMMPY